tara:strand:+ start:40233 stop:41621 length:1389 start_codon:yes stop_codon:yes gene_type:complete
MEKNPQDTRNNNIVIPDNQFNYNNLRLADPISVQGGSYFTKITNNQYPLYVQTPKCMTLKGFIKSGKKIHSDLVFNNNDDVFIQWLVDLESKCEDLLYQKSSDWFQSPLELDDIQNAFNSCVKIQKTGNYVLRTNVKLNSLTQDPLIKIYNESENVLSMEDVIPDTNIIVILEIKGVKFTSKNFQLEAEMKQVMVLNKDLFENCLIRPTTTPVVIQNNSEKSPKTLENIETKQMSQLDIDNVIEETNNTKDLDDLIEAKKDEDIAEKFSDEELESSDSDDDSIEKLTLGEQLVALEEIDNIEDSSKTSTEDEIVSANILSENLVNLETKESVPSPKTSPKASMNTEESEVSIEALNKEKEIVENILEDIKPNSPTSTILNEVDIDSTALDPEVLQLNKPSEYYYELYKQVRETARQQKQSALENYMKAKNIKNTYMLDDISDTSDDIQNIGSDVEEEMEMPN